MSEEGFSLALPFDTDNPEFCRGVEAGRLWEQLKRDEVVEQTIHGTNAEMAMRMCEELGRSFSAEPLDEDAHWLEFRSPALEKEGS